VNDNNISILDALNKSKELSDKHEWPRNTDEAKLLMLYMIEELGESIALIKKKKNQDLLVDGLHRERFVEELTDVFMYYTDILNCYNISSEEFSNAYLKKMNKNLKRDYETDHKEF